MTKRTFLLLFISLLAFEAGFCQTPSATVVNLPSRTADVELDVAIDTGVMVIGEQRQLRIKLNNLHDGKQMPNAAFPTLDMLTNAAIEALASTNDTTLRKDGTIACIEQRVTMTSFEAGRHAVTGIVLQCEEQGRVILLAPEDSLFIEAVYASTADTNKCELREDAPFLNERLTFHDIIQWVSIVLFVAVIAMAVILLIYSRKTHKPIPFLPKAKPVPADKKALGELEALRRKELWQKGRIKKYYTDMTDIVRRFLRNMYGISAAEMTTRQTLRAFHNISDWSEESESLLRQLLQQADMVKFAKSQPETHEHDLAMQTAINFVRKVAETHQINTPVNSE